MIKEIILIAGYCLIGFGFLAIMAFNGDEFGPYEKIFFLGFGGVVIVAYKFVVNLIFKLFMEA